MSQDSRHPGASGADKLEMHNRQQLSALVDGELAPDEARFLLRRLDHDQELAGCYERWQLAGQVMRGQATVLAGSGLALGVAEAIRSEARVTLQAQAGGRRRAVGRWGGGAAAIAASVAAVAFWVGRPQLPAAAPGVAPAMVAEAVPAPAAPVETALAEAAAAPGATVPPAAMPAAPAVREAAAPVRVATAAPRRPATPRPAPTRATQGVPVPAPLETATAALPLPTVDSTDPFASTSPLQARPWPRAVLPQAQAAGGAYTASFGPERAGSTFYPFEPRLPEPEAQPAPESGLPAPPPAQPGARPR